MDTGPRLLVALDYADFDSADALVRELDPALCRLKVGKELFTSAGPACVQAWQARGFDVFLDLKYHDIPHTVAAACRAAAELGVWMVNVHALGGRRMLEAARHALRRGDGPLLVAVTVLTSLDDEDLAEIGLGLTAPQLAMCLADLAHGAGCDGIVCSAHEARELNARFAGELRLVTPGVRPHGSPVDDQRRTMTPAAALAAGSSYLVIGRPISGASDPAAALRALAEEIESTPR